jgi:hypothetical protein
MQGRSSTVALSQRGIRVDKLREYFRCVCDVRWEQAADSSRVRGTGHVVERINLSFHPLRVAIVSEKRIAASRGLLKVRANMVSAPAVSSLAVLSESAGGPADSLLDIAPMTLLHSCCRRDRMCASTCRSLRSGNQPRSLRRVPVGLCVRSRNSNVGGAMRQRRA